jgi:protein-disulfide isomerase-like protein with CxxC motif
MKDILEQQIPLELRDRIAFARVDTDPVENHHLCRQLQLRGLPSLALYRDGELIEIVAGLRVAAKEEIIEHLRKLVS